jgi:O-antigen ligase
MGQERKETSVAAAIAAAATCLPTLVAYNAPPSPTFLNQALALAVWGAFVYACSRATPNAARLPLALPAGAALAALGLLALSAFAAAAWGSLPASLALSALGAIAGAAVLLCSGANAAANRDHRLFALFCTGWVLAGLCSSAIGLIQVFLPDLPDGNWLALSSLPGRAVGNLRQPNHLSSLLMWSSLAIVALIELRRLAFGAGAALCGLMIVGVVLTASRTGGLSVLLLALWGLLDRRLTRRSRRLLLAAPALYALAWLLLAWWSDAAGHRFGGTERLAEGDLSASRLGIWANTLVLIVRHPWAGVGFGEFNLAWSLTPLPGRPTAFFDHAHNLPLHLAAELGLPLAIAITGLLLYALGRAAWRAWRTDGDDGLARRTAVLFVVMIGLHSLLEYPLWYAYFLLPTAWALGYAVDAEGGASRIRVAPWFLPLGGAALVAGAAFALYDYGRVVTIFAAAEGAPPLQQRVAEGQRSIFFAHHADYAAATTPGLSDTLEPFRGAVHYLLDTRLMVAWAAALEAAGREDDARHIAARLREFRNPMSDEFFAPCATAASAAVAFQCRSPARALAWRDFVR